MSYSNADACCLASWCCFCIWLQQTLLREEERHPNETDGKPRPDSILLSAVGGVESGRGQASALPRMQLQAAVGTEPTEHLRWQQMAGESSTHGHVTGNE